MCGQVIPAPGEPVMAAATSMCVQLTALNHAQQLECVPVFAIMYSSLMENEGEPAADLLFFFLAHVEYGPRNFC